MDFRLIDLPYRDNKALDNINNSDGLGVSACNNAFSTFGGEETFITSGLADALIKGSKTMKVNNISIISNVQDPDKVNFKYNPLLPKRFVAPKDHSRPQSVSEIVHWFNGSSTEPKLYQYLYYHLDDNNNPSRQIRKEFREVISTGCAVITHYYDVLTGKLGFQDNKSGWVSLTYSQLSKRIGASLNRVKRFFALLKKKGLVTIIAGKKKLDKRTGKWLSDASTKIIHASFFIKTLGINAWKKMQQLKDWLLKKSKPKTTTEKQNLSILKGLFASAAKSVSNVIKSPQSSITQRPHSNPDRERQLLQQAKALHERNPSKSPLEYLRELKTAPC